MEVFKRNTVKQLIRFGLVGVLNTIISLFVTYSIIVLNQIFSFFYVSTTVNIVFASFIGFSISFINSYFFNKRFVFKSFTRNKNMFFKSYVCYATTWFISYVLGFVFSVVLQVPQIFVPILSLVVTVPLNFLANKFWAFK